MSQETKTFLESAPQADSICADLIGSVACRLPIEGALQIDPESQARHGDVVLVRVLEVNQEYDALETPEGSETSLHGGELIVGALGDRQALHGFSGKPPDRLTPGTALHLLNKGGVIGECTAFHRDLGWPTKVEFLGTLVHQGRAANLEDFALPLKEDPLPDIPLVIVLGTCMDAGKTSVCKKLVHSFSEKGFCINAGKVAGVASHRDVLAMKKHGAQETLSFHDFGLPSTIQLNTLAPIARSMVHYLAQSEPHFIVLEMGDGLLGGYHGSSLLKDSEFMKHCIATILCANDLMGTWGALQWMSQLGHQHSPLLISGRVTDSAEGIRYIENEWHLPAANAFDCAGKICTFVQESLMPWSKLE